MTHNSLGRLGLAAAAFAVVAISSASVSTQLYATANWGGDGTPFSNPVGAPIITPQVSFGTDYGWYWYPLGYGPLFGAQTTGFIRVQTTGDYTFGIGSDDGSSFTLNGDMLTNYDDHGPSTTWKTYHLDAGVLNPFTINFYENGWGDSGYDLYLQNPTGGYDLVPAEMFVVPEPATILALGLGAAALLRRRRR